MECYKISYKDKNETISKFLLLEEQPKPRGRMTANLAVVVYDKNKHLNGIFGGEGSRAHDTVVPRGASISRIQPKEFASTLIRILHETYVEKSGIAEVLANLGIKA